ncbi:MAG: hypothetical protein D6791_04625, partial [Chloroflexi bacterium]
YQRVVDIGARDYLGQGYAGLGDVYLALGQLNRAMMAYQEAARAGRDWEDVLRTRIRAVSERPNGVQAYERLALAYAAANRQNDALKELNAGMTMASSEAERTELENLMTLVKE